MSPFGTARDESADPAATLAALDRRTFLRISGAIAALGLLPSGCGSSALAPPADLALAHLSPRSYATFQAAALTILGREPAAIVRSGAVDPARLADAWLTRAPALAAPLQQGLLVLEFAPWPLLPKYSRFSVMTDEARVPVVAHLAASTTDWKRALFAGLKSLACMTFYSASPSRAVSHYPGPFGKGPGGIEDAMRYEIVD